MTIGMLCGSRDAAAALALVVATLLLPARPLRWTWLLDSWLFRCDAVPAGRVGRCLVVNILGVVSLACLLACLVRAGAQLGRAGCPGMR